MQSIRSSIVMKNILTRRSYLAPSGLKATSVRVRTQHTSSKGSQYLSRQHTIESEPDKNEDISRHNDTNVSGPEMSSDKTDSKAELHALPDEKKKAQTMAERDEALKRALENISGEGGEAGLELENGQPVTMKRGVKSNMFRYI